MACGATLEEVIDLAKRLPLRDKVRLIEKIAPQIEQELKVFRQNPRKSLRGLWRGLDITEDEIDATRSEMWSQFPREDI